VIPKTTIKMDYIRDTLARVSVWGYIEKVENFDLSGAWEYAWGEGWDDMLEILSRADKKHLWYGYGQLIDDVGQRFG
jgi:hypothetical protein